MKFRGVSKLFLVLVFSASSANNARAQAPTIEFDLDLTPNIDRLSHLYQRLSRGASSLFSWPVPQRNPGPVYLRPQPPVQLSRSHTINHARPGPADSSSSGSDVSYSVVEAGTAGSEATHVGTTVDQDAAHGHHSAPDHSLSAAEKISHFQSAANGPVDLYAATGSGGCVGCSGHGSPEPEPASEHSQPDYDFGPSPPVYSSAPSLPDYDSGPISPPKASTYSSSKYSSGPSPPKYSSGHSSSEYSSGPGHTEYSPGPPPQTYYSSGPPKGPSPYVSKSYYSHGPPPPKYSRPPKPVGPPSFSGPPKYYSLVKSHGPPSAPYHGPPNKGYSPGPPLKSYKSYAGPSKSYFSAPLRYISYVLPKSTKTYVPSAHHSYGSSSSSHSHSHHFKYSSPPKDDGWGWSPPPKPKGWGWSPPTSPPKQEGWGWPSPPPKEEGWGWSPPTSPPKQEGWGWSPPPKNEGWGWSCPSPPAPRVFSRLEDVPPGATVRDGYNRTVDPSVLVAFEPSPPRPLRAGVRSDPPQGFTITYTEQYNVQQQVDGRFTTDRDVFHTGQKDRTRSNDPPTPGGYRITTMALESPTFPAPLDGTSNPTFQQSVQAVMNAGQSARFRDPQEEQTEALLQLFNELDTLQTEQNEMEDKKETGWGWSQDEDGFDGGANGRNGSGSGGYSNGGRGSSDIATPITVAMVQRFSIPEPNSSERNILDAAYNFGLQASPISFGDLDSVMDSWKAMQKQPPSPLSLSGLGGSAQAAGNALNDRIRQYLKGYRDATANAYDAVEDRAINAFHQEQYFIQVPGECENEVDPNQNGSGASLIGNTGAMNVGQAPGGCFPPCRG